MEIIGLVFEIVLGTIGHFLYEWSGYNKLVGFLFSKNESTWEHMKLGITPIILWTCIELLTGNINNLFFAKFSNIIAFSFTLLVLYTTYKYIVKKNILFVDILIFYISLFVGKFVSLKIINANYFGPFLNFISLIGIIFMFYLYNKFNYKVPKWFIFNNY